MSKLKHTARVAPLALLAVVVACSDSEAPVAPDAEARLELIEDEAVLSQRVIDHDDLDLALDATVITSAIAGGTGISASTAATQSVSLKLVAEVDPPTVGGVELEATHVAISGPFAFVSYAKIGSTARGAVDMFLVTNPARPRLITSLRLSDTDVFSVGTDGLGLYCGENTSDKSFAHAATVERVGIVGSRLRLGTARAAVPGFVTTGVASGGGRLHVAAGSPGGLTTLDSRTLAQVAHDPFDDARAVARSGPWLVAVQGSPGRLRIYDANTLNLRSSVSVGGLGIPGSKASVDIEGNFAFVSLGDGGMAVVDLVNEQVVASLPRPSLPGVAPADAVTNAVTFSGNLIFLAQGGAGVWAAGKADVGGQPTLAPLGRILFPGPVSSNYVAARGNTLFVAAGRGGLKIVRIAD